MNQIDVDGSDVIIKIPLPSARKEIQVRVHNRQTLVSLGQFRKLTCDEFGDL